MLYCQVFDSILIKSKVKTWKGFYWVKEKKMDCASEVWAVSWSASRSQTKIAKDFYLTPYSHSRNVLHAVEMCRWQVLSCVQLCNPMDCGPPGSSVHGISQARILWCVAISFSRESSQARDWTQVSPGDLPKPGTEPRSPASPALEDGFFATSTTWETHGNVDIYFLSDG